MSVRLSIDAPSLAERHACVMLSGEKKKRAPRPYKPAPVGEKKYVIRTTLHTQTYGDFHAQNQAKLRKKRAGKK